MKNLKLYICITTAFMNIASANCPVKSGDWVISGIVKLKAKSDNKIRISCNKITFLKNSKIIAYDNILIRSNYIDGPVNIKTINGRKLSQLNDRTRAILNPQKNHSVYLDLNHFNLESYTIDTRGFDGADGIPGLNGKDQDDRKFNPIGGEHGGAATDGQEAGDLILRFNSSIHDLSDVVKHHNLIKFQNDGGNPGIPGKGGKGGYYLNSSNTTVNGKNGRRGGKGAYGIIKRYGDF